MSKRKSTLAAMEALADKLAAPPDPTFRMPPLIECREGIYSDSVTGQVIGDELAFGQWRKAQQVTGPSVPGWLAVVIELDTPKTAPDLTEPNET